MRENVKKRYYKFFFFNKIEQQLNNVSLFK